MLFTCSFTRQGWQQKPIDNTTWDHRLRTYIHTTSSHRHICSLHHTLSLDQMRPLTPLPIFGTAVCRELANQKSENRYCACSVFERSKEKRERIAFRFFGSCKNSANRCRTHLKNRLPLGMSIQHRMCPHQHLQGTRWRPHAHTYLSTHLLTPRDPHSVLLQPANLELMMVLFPLVGGAP